MAAPQTNLEKQKRVHKGPLIGITVVLFVVLAVFVFWIFGEVGGADSGESAVPAELPLQSGSVDQGAVTESTEAPAVAP